MARAGACQRAAQRRGMDAWMAYVVPHHRTFGGFQGYWLKNIVKEPQFEERHKSSETRNMYRSISKLFA